MLIVVGGVFWFGVFFLFCLFVLGVFFKKKEPAENDIYLFPKILSAKLRNSSVARIMTTS